MILTAFINGIILFNSFLITLLPTLPQMPSNITSPINTVLTTIFSNIELLDIFVPLHLVLILLPLVIVVSNFNFGWSIVNWIWCHIPVFGANK